MTSAPFSRVPLWEARYADSAAVVAEFPARISEGQMNLRWVVKSSAILTLALQGLVGPATISFVDAATWSTGAADVSRVPGDRKTVVVSPDSKKSIVIDRHGFYVTEGGTRLPGMEDDAGFDVLAELTWAPDSSAFVVTWSDGGIVGTWRVNVYLVDGSRVRRVDPTAEVVKHFKTQYRCDGSEEPNVAAIRWAKGSQRLLLVAEVPPHSSCPEMGKVMGYMVSVPKGAILERFSHGQLKRQWGRHLGERLR